MRTPLNSACTRRRNGSSNRKKRDVAAEDRVGDGGRLRERHAVLPEQHGLPRRGQRARHTEGEEDDQTGEHPRRDRAEVGDVVGVPGDARRAPVVGRAPAPGATGAPDLRGLGRLVEPIEQVAHGPAAGDWRRRQAAGKPQVAEQDDERQHEPEHEQPNLGGDSRPVHVRVPDALEPQRVGPDLDAECEERNQRQEDERRQADPKRATSAANARTEATAVVRTAGFRPRIGRGG